jgi:hypothetical protein
MSNCKILLFKFNHNRLITVSCYYIKTNQLNINLPLTGSTILPFVTRQVKTRSGSGFCRFYAFLKYITVNCKMCAEKGFEGSTPVENK